MYFEGQFPQATQFQGPTLSLASLPMHKSVCPPNYYRVQEINKTARCNGVTSVFALVKHESAGPNDEIGTPACTHSHAGQQILLATQTNRSA
jgi:hypothetical protein